MTSLGSKDPVVVIGAGPAGLTAAYELSRQGVPSLILEKGERVGGISRTERYKGYGFDIGGHRFFTKVEEVNKVWHDILKEEFIRVPRMSRIYYKGKFYDYPLKAFNALWNLGIWETTLCMLSYAKVRVKPLPKEDNFEQWVTNRFGSRLFNTFFKTYTEKVWGIPCTKIQAEWAAQRIKGMSLIEAVKKALFGKSSAKSLIDEFDYPVQGPGQMWERCTEICESKGCEVKMHTDVVKVHRDGFKINGITLKENGVEKYVASSHVFNSMPLSELIFKMEPPAPQHVIDAAKGLKYRDFLIVALILKKKDLFPDNWIYVHSPEVKVGRIQNFRNWSAAMIPVEGTTSIGMEYFCSIGDELWSRRDEDLIELAKSELPKLNLATREDIIDAVVVRQPKAYPVYDGEYRGHVETIRQFMTQFENLATVGRNGMHRYNNQDHSMLTAILAAKNYFGEKHDLWEVNTERSYHEEMEVKDKQAKTEPVAKAMAAA